VLSALDLVEVEREREIQTRGFREVLGHAFFFNLQLFYFFCLFG
jgi:hypothetical protein